MAPDFSVFGSHEYFAWLCDRVAVPPGAGKYHGLLNTMSITEFVWIVANDENRISDGRDLRNQYLVEHGLRNDIYAWPVSFLEVLIALSERVAFLVDGEPVEWAWKLIKNLKLGGFHDPLSGKELLKIMHVLENVIWRRYGPDGSGGFFPLSRPKNDQRVVEIWDQMSAYIEENKVSFGL